MSVPESAAPPYGGRVEAPRLLGELRELLRLAVPIAVAQAGIALMGVVDTAVVGRLGAAALGAVGLANGIFFAVAVIGIGTVMGLDPLIAQAFGARDRPRTRALVWQGAWLALIVSAVLAVPLAFAPGLIDLAGIEPEVARGAKQFLWARLPGLLPMLLFIGLRAYLQAAAVLRPLLVATVLANLANFLLDLLLVFGGANLPAWSGPLRHVPAMGPAGSGLATTLCSFLQAGVLLAAASPLREPVAPPRAPDLRDLRAAARVGVPVGLQMGAEVGVFTLVGVLAGRLGQMSIAAHQVAISLASFTFCAAVGVGNAGSVRVGWAIGARDSRAARRSGLIAFAAGASIMTLSALAFWLFPRQVASLLSDRADVIAASAPLLAVAAVFQISDGVQAVGAGVLRGAGDTRFAFLANLVGHYAVGLPVAVALGLFAGRGVLGLWWGLCAGLTAVAVALLWRFLRLSSRDIAPLEKHPIPHI
ncbi:MAG TPA: MATE family efflux transporter [Myxococcales bacterium]|jgi:MATE family, multidrug efflux pump|nr:MATE family efflux transporter [Myxococcales bacterium]